MASRTSPRSPVLPALLVLLALCAPLLAACGGSASPSRVALQATPAPVVAASAPTAAPAAEAPTASTAAGGPAEALSDAPSGAAPAEAPAAVIGAAPTALPESSGPLPGAQRQPTPAIVASQQQQPALRAGEIDDNQDFAAYLGYLAGAQGIRARQLDVSERYLITVMNEDQQPVLDARVRLYDQQALLFEGRTYAGGKTIFFPRGLNLSANTNTLRVEITKGNSNAGSELKLGRDYDPIFVLRGAPALPATPRLDVLFLLDATGSMDDEISRIQLTIASIAERIDSIQPRPELRFGLVSYRDRGDEYVTRAFDFTGDLATFREQLLQVHAAGGGDEPESLNEALHMAVQQVGWADDAVRLTFLVADAPPHLDYQQDYDYIAEAGAAVARGVKIYTIAASNTGHEAEYILRQIAQQTLAHFIFLTYQPGQNAGAPGDSTVHQVDPNAFTVERLDDLVVQVVQRELALAQGIG